MTTDPMNTTPTPTEPQDARGPRMVVDHDEAWEAVEANSFLSHEAKCEVHTILDDLAKPLAAVSAADLDAIRALRQQYDRVLDGPATPETAEIALELADAMVEKMPALLAALAAAHAETEREHREAVTWRDLARAEKDQRDEARAALAALREQYRDLATYRTTHANLGLCPEGPDDPARDPDCPVCAALGAAPSETEEGR